MQKRTTRIQIRLKKVDKMAKRIIILNGSPRNNFVLQQFYTSLCRIFFFIPTKKITVRAAVIKIAIVSAIGAAKSIPSMPRKTGIMQTSGTKQIISRINDVNTAKTGFPTAWKNIEEN